MLQFFRRFLVAKLALIVLTAVIAGFAISFYMVSSRQLETMERMNRMGASFLAKSLASGVRNAMLRGDGLAVRDYVEETQAGIQRAQVKIFSPTGEEVFGQPAPAPDIETLPVHVRTVLGTLRQHSGPEQSLAFPIKNTVQCTACHAEGKLRGVLTIGADDSNLPVNDSQGSLQALTDITSSAFIQIMTGRHEENLDDYFDEVVAEVSGIQGMSVFTTESDAFFTGGSLELPEHVLNRALLERKAFSFDDKGLQYRIVPLENEPRCQGCHDDDEEMRGVLAVAFEPTKLAGQTTLQEVTITSLRHVMLAGLGRLVHSFLHDVTDTGLVNRLTLHDRQGRLYHDGFQKPDPPSYIRRAFATQRPVVAGHEELGHHGQFLYVEPLFNEKRCQQCHGTDSPMRGAIAITLDTSEEEVEMAAQKQQSVFFAGTTIIMVLLLLYFGLRLTVLRPVHLIGSAADKIGEGNLDSRVELHALDEMGRLAQRINDMTDGLRQKLELHKFVSRETLETVQTTGIIQRGGVRREITVLFSDIRGFTAYSETREPEEVIDMLNDILQIQAVVVTRHGGDIDKFVGDEMMVRFDGPGHAERAVQCAVELLTAVDTMNTTREQSTAMAIGVGVNTGDMVLGAMGAEKRMDFTVIGDAVNLGARLCSAAKGGEVLISNYVRDAMDNVPDLLIEAMEPIRVKGKQEPIQIFRVRAEPTNKAPS